MIGRTLTLLFFALVGQVCAQSPPSTVNRNLTNNSTTLTVNFTLHPIRNPNHEVQIQNADGNFTSYTAGPARTYIGTVAGRPDALAAGCQRANGTFLSFVVFGDGTAWSSSGTSATASGNANWPAAWPTTTFTTTGGAGSAVYSAELGIDASYREYLATGSNIDACIELMEFYVMKANIIYLRDAAILHRIGRHIIRTSAAACPYEAISNSDWNTQLNTFRSQWNTVLPAAPHHLARTQDVALMVKPGIAGGLAYVGTIATSSGYSINGATSGDFSGIWRHEVGHNWGSSHYEGGGKPEGGTIMSDNNLARISTPELAKMIRHRNERLGSLDNLGAYPFPLPPRANGDRAVMTPGIGSLLIDVLANDSDSNGEALSLHSFNTASSSRALIARSSGTGPGGRDRLLYFSPPNTVPAFDHFNYTIQDSAGYESSVKVYVTPTDLPPLPPLWTSQDIGSVSTPGDAGHQDGTYISYASGTEIWTTADAFRYTWLPAQGDCDIRARVTAQANTADGAKAGVMIRSDAAANSAHAMMMVTPGKGFLFQYRNGTGNATTQVAGPALNSQSNNWVRMTRAGNLFTAFVSADGLTWTQIGSPVNISMPATATAGLASSAAAGSTVGGAAFDQVSLADGSAQVTLLDDTFDSTSATPLNDDNDPWDITWTGYGASLSQANDEIIGSGQALNFDATSSFANLRGNFAGRSLAKIGDTLRLDFDFRFTQSPANNFAGFRFGLFNSSGDGFGAHHGTGGGGQFSVIEGVAGFGSGTYSTLASVSKASLADQTAHTATLTLKRSATGVQVTSLIDGVAVSSADSSPVTTIFDTISIGNGAVTTDFRVDNVRLRFFRSIDPAFSSNPIFLANAAAGLIYTGNLIDYTVVADPSLTFTKTAGPAWLMVAADGSISGVPSSADVGANSFTVRATNPDGVFAETTLSIQVSPSAVPLYWDGSGISWNSASSWSTVSSAILPDPASVPGPSNRAAFNITPLSTAQTVNLDSDPTLDSLLFQSTGTITLQGGGVSRAISLGSGGITLNPGAGAVTIGSASAGQGVNITLLASQTWTNASGSFTINNPINGEGHDLTLVGNHMFRANSGTLNLGTGSLTHQSGTLDLQNNPNTIGNVFIHGGVVFARNTTALGATGTITLGTGGGNSNASLAFSTSTFTKPIVLGATTGTLSLGNFGFQSPVINSPITGNNHLTVTGTISTTSGNSSYTMTLGGPINHAGNLTLSNSGTGEDANGIDNGSILVTGVIGSQVANVTVRRSTNASSGVHKSIFANSGNAYAGSTTVNANALLQLGISNTIPDGVGKGDVSINGTLDLNANHETLNGLFGSGFIDNTALGSPILTVGAASTSATYSGSLGNSAGTLSLTKIGAGTQTLAGPNTHTGTNTLSNNGGTLRITHPSALGSGAVGILKTGTSSGTLALDLAGENTFVNPFSGFNSTTFTGSTTVPCILNLNGANTLTSPLTISGTGGNGLAVSSDGGTLTLSGTISQTAGTFRGLHINGTGQGIITGSILAGTGGFSLTKDGTGTWTLAGDNTYQSGTTIAQGTLRIGSGGTTGTIGSGGVTNHGKLVIDRSNLLTIANIIQGTGTLIQSGSGTTTLSASNTYTGDSRIENGGLSISQPFLHDASDVHLTTGATLHLAHLSTDTIDELFIDGFRQKSGTWGAHGSGADHETDLISGTGKLRVMTGEATDPYADWVTFHELDGPASEPGEDFDADGLANFLEYALGTDPKKHTAVPSAVLEGGILSLTHTLNLAATDITLRAEWSGDLVTWSEDGIESEILSESAGIRILMHSRQTGEEPGGFLRLRVSQLGYLLKCGCSGCLADPDSFSFDP